MITRSRALTAENEEQQSSESSFSSVEEFPVMANPTPTFSIEFFDEKNYTFDRWYQRMKGAFTIFNVREENIQKSYLLHYIGLDTYNLLCDGFSPNLPEEKTIDEIIAELKNHFNPTPIEIAEIFKFQTRTQMEGESMKEYIAILKKLAVHCNFGAYLSNALRNQFVCGLRNRKIKEHLLGLKDLTFQKSVEVACSMENTQKETAEISEQPHTVYSIQKAKAPVHGNPRSFQKNVSSTASGAGSKTCVTTTNKSIVCFRCGGGHFANSCKHVSTQCNHCGITGHLSRVCQRRAKTSKSAENNFVYEICDNKDEVVEYINSLFSKNITDKYLIDVKIQDTLCKMELDSGSAYSMMSWENFRKLGIGTEKIVKDNTILFSYTGNKVDLLGFVEVSVELVKNTAEDYARDTVLKLKLHITKEGRPSLFGREWIAAFKGAPLLNVLKEIQSESVSHVSRTRAHDSIAQCSVGSQINDLLKKYEVLFQDEAGVLKGDPVSIELKSNSQPVSLRFRPVPFALRHKIEDEINKLVEDKILIPVNHSEWSTPIVPVLKADGQIRLCGDFKTTLNKHMLVDEYPLPTTDELFAVLNGGDKFSRIDLKKAYLQWEVREEDQSKLTLATHKGLFKCTRLLFGLSCAPTKWQRKIENILAGIEGVGVFIDDICVTGPDDQTHLKRLEQVLKRLEEHGLRINKKKTEFFKDSVEYCGFKINKFGIHKTKSKVEAITKAPIPSNVSELRSFLGLVNYYGRFFEKLADTLEPLHSLIRKDADFVWSKSCARAFNTIKEQMLSETVLAHYDPQLEICLASDASPTGVGAVLSHVFPDGTERPIAFASQTLSTSQRKWAQIDKEAYAIIFGVKKFHQYLFGRSFTLYTDHKPLTYIFSEDKVLPHMSAMRMQHYAIFLQGFRYQIKYKKSEMNLNADALSRLPLAIEENKAEESDIFEINQISHLPVTAEAIADATLNDPELSTLLSALKSGKTIEPRKRFNIDQHEFALQEGCIMRGIKVVIPKSFQKRILDELHSAHFGTTRMKELSRSFVWWHKIDKDIEHMAGECLQCNQNSKDPKKVPIHKWEKPSKPFERIHVDFAGPYLQRYFLIIIDAFSKWPEVYILKNITTGTTIPALQSTFAQFGIPEKLVSDNGAQFTSFKFRRFCEENGIKHFRSAPFHPATNGQAERFVQTLKAKLKCLSNSEKDLHEKVQSILSHYRITPHYETGKSPAEILFKYPVRSKFSLISPKNMGNKSQSIDQRKVKSFKKGDRVAVRDYLHAQRWQFGVIVKVMGRLHYRIRLDDGREWKRHVDQMRKTCVSNDKLEAEDQLCSDEEPCFGFDVGENSV